jgi:chromate transporter
MKTLWDLFIAFFRASNFSFGGGPASIPLVQAEVVNKYKWLSNEEFADVLAIANSLPAPIATKLAGMIGYRVKGWLGALLAVLGVFLPTTLVVVFLGGLIAKYADAPALQAMLKGVRPVVAVLLAQTAIQMGKKAFSGKITWMFGIAALFMMLFLPSIHPAFLVIASMALGYFLFKK